MKKILWVCMLFVGLISLSGCSSLNNWWNKTSAGMTSSDYVIVKYDLNGKPARYWIIRNNFVNNEENSDGYYWSANGGGIDRATNADVYDVKGLSDQQIIEIYHLQNALEIN